MKKTLMILWCLISTWGAWAQQFSYIYIQSEKDVPFYVKYYDEMMPRYGKNYTVLSRLAPGPIQIKILFEQNIHPPVNFNILVPEAGERSFMLTQKGTEFVLYDLTQKIELQAGNNINDDKIPTKAKTFNISDEVAVEEKGRLAPVGKHGNPRFKELAPGEVRQDPYKAPVVTKPAEVIKAETKAERRKREKLERQKAAQEEQAAKDAATLQEREAKALVAQQEKEARDAADQQKKEARELALQQDKAAKTLANQEQQQKREEEARLRKERQEQQRLEREKALAAKTANNNQSNEDVIALPVDNRPVLIAKKNTPSNTQKSEPQFLSDISLPNRHNNPSQPTEDEPLAIPEVYAATQSVTMGCDKAMNGADFTAFRSQWRRQINDEARINLFSTKSNLCLSAAMVAQLSGSLSSDAARYSWLTKIFKNNPRVDEAAQFSSVFTSNTYKTAYLQFIEEQKSR